MTIRFLSSFSLGVAALVAAVCSYAGAQAAPGNVHLVSADAMLVQNVDAKNAAPGQMVTAKLTSNVKEAGQTELPKGTMLVGKVEQVEKSGNGPSKLAIVFDHAQLSDGKTMPVKATLLAAYPANTEAYYAETSNNGLLTAVQPRVISDDEKVDQEPGTLGHVAMHSSVRSNDSAVFISQSGDLKLERGTRFQIAIAPATGAAS